MKLLKNIIFLMIFSAFISLGRQSLAFAPNFLHCSDEINNSAPATSTTHTIFFKINNEIPPLGRIKISFQSEFNIPSSFDCSDIDFATSSSKNGPYQQRYLTTSSTSTIDNVEIIPGAGGSITINLNENIGLHAGEWVKVLLGKSASFQGQGSQGIVNPASVGSYKIYLKGYTSTGVLINQSEMMVAVVNPVAVNATAPPDIYPPYRYNGSPTGTVAENTKSVSLSLDTDEWAYCRYATSAGLSYASMTAELSSAPSFHHSTVISGLSNGQTYKFYIRCNDIHDNMNQDDYLIAFSVKAPVPAPPGAGGGVAGGAPYPPMPSAPSLKILGWAYPLASIDILKDGKLAKTITAKNDATFLYVFNNLKQGVYTFGIKATDSKGRKSIMDSTTLSLRAGTNNLIKSFIPPTIDLSKEIVKKGDIIKIKGQSVPSSSIEIWVYMSPEEGKKILESNLIKLRTTTTQNGLWEAELNTSALFSKKTYQVKARSLLFSGQTSDFSEIKFFGIDTKPKANYALMADLNKDGKVNLIDFSILLFYWGKTEKLADINSDGRVGLTDFSIMMYYWTG